MSRREPSGHGGTPTDVDVIDRLARLRSIVPVLAADLAVARRRAHTLALDNHRLTRRVAELESKLAHNGVHSRRSSPETLEAPSSRQPTLGHYGGVDYRDC
ncbi:MAG TPA: hypothetical protein VHX66_13490 [Solirubrobacteraceae bacterium]|jgi:hypothetical protein|nr:hypothetical protein [Solirubrobacteraceae bacterium]